jgi:glycine cleavage system H protein
MGKKFSSDHVWVQAHDDGTATVGITVHAQDQLGDVVFVEFPTVGSHYAKGDVAGVVESVKAAADVLIPVSGNVTGLNDALRDDPSLVNSAPLDAGWFFKMKLADSTELDALMDPQAYSAFSG